MTALGDQLPDGFVHLSDIDPTIRQDVRYAGSLNFLGRPARGYEAADCILTEVAAKALSAVQAKLAAEHLTLVVFDCYRPARAVADFVEWVGKGGGADPRWYPRTRRNDLIAEGYIASRSGHSRGSTVDLAIAPAATADAAPDPDCGAAQASTLEFGTGFDCLDDRSRTTFRPLSHDAIANRALLVKTMRSAGFANYKREWWHFTLKAEPFKDTAFDFPVTK